MERRKIGLALSGGGARGFAHVGVLKVLAEHNIPIDMVAGTSAGSIVGGALASGMSIDGIIAMTGKIGYTNTMRPSARFGGMLSSAPLGKFLKHHFPVSRFEDMPIPYAAVAFDLSNNKKVVLKESGDLITAIRASCAVPGIFAPIRHEDDRMLVDGGVVSPMPADVVRAMGAEVVIAVDILSCGATFRLNSRTGFGIMLQSVLSTLSTLSTSEHRHADIVIEPAIAHLRPDQIGKRDEFITLGEQAARSQIDAIKALVN